MESKIIDLVVAWAVPTALGAALGYFATLTLRLRKEQAAYRDGIRTLLRSRLVDLHERYVAAGIPCPDTIKREADQVYGSYHALGGNGIGTHYYEEIVNAPVGAERG